MYILLVSKKLAMKYLVSRVVNGIEWPHLLYCILFTTVSWHFQQYYLLESSNWYFWTGCITCNEKVWWYWRNFSLAEVVIHSWAGLRLTPRNSCTPGLYRLRYCCSCYRPLWSTTSCLWLYVNRDIVYLR